MLGILVHNYQAADERPFVPSPAGWLRRMLRALFARL
jgi:hypothetical protein